ncbi:peptidoglycan editing factor PgeF [Priestia megaterium]|uniref:Purine nucleoside phosphorylase n=1 Tax=Priestia aryabhattai TaxID=412384 RepID=A0ABD5KZ87_PRIAR|nr:MULTISPECIES: peptidoglycan editing factor PgeF [Priestia]MBK0293249.1 peptidoglycan editing factor PgeF [Bacillus sp. S34]AWD64075.1 peptidoglycan editing factor PgeF [Priestia megaterium]MCA1051615.1 peptidoglycan editing factor PgeF [Priestia aryabhattai]MDC7766084.1 peptidoglycan editing factor PgeF [Priestia aryabhattai]MEB4885223.1 peptidoglycan editing factor PgeF [Priestia megaterium]
MNPEPLKKSHHESFMWLSPWVEKNDMLVAGFTTKNGGVSKPPFASFNLGLHVNDNVEDVITNRKILAAELDMSFESFVCAEQVHEATVQKVTKADCAKGLYKYEEGIKAADGIYTNESDILLALCYADCVPLYFYAPDHHLVGLAHAGWKGTVKDIAGNMIRLWVEQENVPVEDIYVAIGPSIEDCCYVVDNRVITQVNEVVGQNGYQEVSPGQYALNLKKVNKLLVQNAGVLPERILTSSYCTSCEDDLFFSHRRDQGKTGRMFNFIGFKEE